MLKKIFLYESFTFSILIAPFLGYFFDSSVVAYGPMIFFMLMVLLWEILSPAPIRSRDLIAVLLWLPYCSVAGGYYFYNPIDGRLLTSYLLVIISLPVMTLVLLRMRFYSNGFNFSRFLFSSICLFLFFQLLVSLGQISTYVTGVGFPVNENYHEYFMVSGTFFNSNDLGAVVLVMCFIIVGVESQLTVKRQAFFWFLAIVLIFISGSRSALLLVGVIFIMSRRAGLKEGGGVLFLSLLSFVLYSVFLSGADEGVFTRFLHRFDSLVSVLAGGVEADGSMSLRLDSYLHFLRNLGNLGFGSGELNNYIQYSGEAGFDADLMFQNPHSLLVELGYWLGWPGLIFFICSFLYLLRFSNKKVQFIVVFGVSSLIPSSVLGGVVYFWAVVCAVLSPETPLKKARDRAV